MTKISNINFLMLLLVITLVVMPAVHAGIGIFSVGADICSPSWQCSAYSEGSCGSRTCIDINVCGVNLNKPEELVACGSSSSSSSGSVGASNDSIKVLVPKGYFTLDKDFIKLSVEKDRVVQKLITVNSYEINNYNLDIIYPSTYKYTKEFITTSLDSKRIEGKDTFNIVVDPKDVPTGTYVIILNISNEYYSRQVTVVIDLINKGTLALDFVTDSKIKTLGVDESIVVFTKIPDKLFNHSFLLISILDPRGNIIFSDTKESHNSSNITNELVLPKNISEGYYTLVVTTIGDYNYTKSMTFTVITPNKYAPVIETPAKESTNIIFGIFTGLIMSLIIIILLVIIIIQKKANNKIFFKNMSGVNMLSKTFNILSLKKNKKLLNNELNTLKKSYDRGFISLKEYLSALKKRGYTVDTAEHITPKSLSEKIIGQEGPIFESKKTDKLAASSKKDTLISAPSLAINLSTQSILDITTEDKFFVLENGEKLASLRDLMNVLPTMSKHVFNHHTINGRNDFANWTKDVFHNRVLAHDISGVNTKEELIEVLKKHA